MGSPKNTLTSSKRRKGGESRRFSTRSKKRSEDLPAPATLGGKLRSKNVLLKSFACISMLALSFVLFKGWRQRALRRQQLMEDLDSDRLLPGDNNDQKIDSTSLLEELKNKALKSASDIISPGANGANEEDLSDDKLAPKGPSHADGDGGGNGNRGGGDGGGGSHGIGHRGDNFENQEHRHHSHSNDHQEPGNNVPFGHERYAEQQHQQKDETNSEDGSRDRNEAQEEILIREFPSVIEWQSRDDMKNGQRPVCRISKPCMLSNGVIAIPSWMQKREALLQKCGLGTHIYYDSTSNLPGVRHMKMLGVDFALTIHPERFQEPTHLLSVYLNEHLLKSAFLFDTLSGKATIPPSIQKQHCIASGTRAEDCSKPLSDVKFRTAIFVPSKMRTSGKSHGFALRLIDYLGRAYSADGSITHLNLSTVLVKSHRSQSEGLSATCFRSVLTNNAMFRHLPPRSLYRSSMLSKRNHINRGKRPRANIPGVQGCQLVIGVFDLSEGPKGIVNIPEFKRSLENIGKLAVRGGAVSVELLRIEADTSLDEHVRQIQGIDVFVAGSGDEMSSAAFLREGALIFEILQFGMNPDTYRSLANSLGLQYFSLQSRPASDSFKNCMESQVLNLRRKGVLSEGENPSWWDSLIATWDNAAAEFTLTGKTDFDILANHSSIANFDSRHCAKMQNLVFNYEEAARSIMLQAKSLCDAQ